jgi:dienelactone hydrolase
MIGSTVLRQLAAALVLGGAALAVAQDVAIDFKDGPPSGKYRFASSTPKSLAELTSASAAAPAQMVVGHLFLPEGTARVPAVLLVHGSGGVYDALLQYWPKAFNAAGYAVLTLDMFGPRGVVSTADDQGRVPIAADAADAFAALKLLATHPRIDPARIAIMGFSRGGITAWRTAVERIVAAQALPGGLRFAAHIPVYSGGCVGPIRLRVKPGVFDRTPQLWLHGTADDYTTIGPCRDYAQQIAAAGTTVAFVAIDGAGHLFDSDLRQRVALGSAQRLKDDCPIELDIDTLVAVDRRTGQPLQGERLQAALRDCAATGASIEGNAAARDQAAKATLAFLARVFGK